MSDFSLTYWCDDIHRMECALSADSSVFDYVHLPVNCNHTVYPKKYAHGFVVLCFVVVTQSFIMNSHQVFIHIHQGCFAGTGAIVRLPQCQWSKTDGYGKISQCITTTKHSKAKTMCIFHGIYCTHRGNVTSTSATNASEVFMSTVSKYLLSNHLKPIYNDNNYSMAWGRM